MDFVRWVSCGFLVLEIAMKTIVFLVLAKLVNDYLLSKLCVDKPDYINQVCFSGLSGRKSALLLRSELVSFSNLD